MFMDEGRWAQLLTHIEKVWHPASLLMNSQGCGRCWGSRVEATTDPHCNFLGTNSSLL